MSLGAQIEYAASSGRTPDSGIGPAGQPRTAIVHYWFLHRRGGERVVEAIAGMFPDADLFFLLVDPDQLPPPLRSRRIETSFLQKWPGSRRWHRHLLPLYPLALEQFDLRGYDLVLSSESGPAKGVMTDSGACHICYCHSPMRYLWDFYHGYRNGRNFGRLARAGFTLAAHYLRIWDAASAQRVDHFVANSQNVAARIRKHYRRNSTVIYPPVAVDAGYLAEKTGDYYLVVGQLVDYKRVDLAIEACNRLARPLRIVGDGEQYKRLRKLAGPTITFCGSVPDQQLGEHYARARALLFPAEEDFGMVPVEAQSFGRPVIAFGRGGALETVVAHGGPGPASAGGPSGMFFDEQSVEALGRAILDFEKAEHSFHPAAIRQGAQRFSEARFKRDFLALVGAKLHEFRNPEPGR